jgi:beta-lactamase regulating signal transducer with metallopeptidase domain
VAALMGYCMLVALLMSLAAIAAERVLVLRDVPRRAIFGIALAASLLYPTYRIFSPSFAPTVVVRPALDVEPSPSIDSSRPATAHTVVMPAEMPMHRVAIEQSRRQFVWPDLTDWDRPLEWLWIAGSAGLLGFYAIGWFRLRRVARQWPVARIDDIDVRVAEHVGPAVVGLFKPEIVIPRWLLDITPSERAMALAHEREHVSAHDPLLFQICMLLVALAPWNFPLWWQLRRMRFAIEVDCDRRVLRAGCGTNEYGEMLLSVGQRQSGWIPGALALTEKTSQLERRIAVITGAVKRHSGAALIALMGVTVSLIVVAGSLDAPRLDFTPPLLHPQSTYMSPLAQRARVVSRAQFPQLFDQKFDGVAVVVVVFNKDGSLFSATKKEVSKDALPETLHQWARSIPAGGEPEDFAAEENALDAPLGAWADGKNPYRVILVAKVLRWSIDPTRSSARVKQAVLGFFPDLLQAPYRSTVIATVFMNEDGTVKRGERKVLPPGTGFSEDMYPQYSELGVAPEDIGRRAEIEFAWHPAEALNVSLQYAWPRRIDDTPEDPNHWWWVKGAPDPLAAETANDRAVVARYFPGVLENGVRDGNGLWVLVARDGHILSTGQWFLGRRLRTLWLLMGELQARYPGIKPGPCSGSDWPSLQVAGPGGQKIPLAYMCLSIDSPVTDLQNFDLSKRADVFVGGGIFNRPLGDKKHALPFWLTGHFQEQAESEAFYNVQAISADIGPNEVELKVRQHSYANSEWSDWSSPIRVAYGDEATVQVPDRDSGSVEVLLRPVRLAKFP